MGQPLSEERDSLCCKVIVSGTARLIGSEDQKSFTVDKMSKGEIVGLASILNAQAIEEVSAVGARNNCNTRRSYIEIVQ